MANAGGASCGIASQTVSGRSSSTASKATRCSWGSVPGGFVAVSENHLWFGGAEGAVREHAIPTLAPDGRAYLLASDHVSGRVALSLDSSSRIVMVDDRAQLVASLPLPHQTYGWFVDANTLITFGEWNSLNSWSLVDGGLVKQGSVLLKKVHVQFPPHMMPLGVTVLRSAGLLAYGIEHAPPDGYDARTMAVASLPGLLAKDLPVWVSPDERCAVFVDYEGMHVHDLARAMGH